MGFLAQFLALCRKNVIVLSKHWFINLLRCFVLLVAFGVFLGVAQVFLIKPNNLGLGTIAPVKTLAEAFDPAFRLVWADATTGTASPSPHDIMQRLTRGLDAAQLDQVIREDNPDRVAENCPQNFQLYSECYAALIFTSPNTSSSDITYTLRGDAGFFFVDVVKHTTDFEKRVLPLQVAVDQAIIELASGQPINLPQPLSWEFTQETNEEQDLRIRLSFVRGFRSLLVLAFFACFLGIVYHLAGSVQSERALGVTSHMKAMGLLDSARVISWHVSISAAYLPAWIITALVWRFRIFSATNTGLVIVIHLLTGFSLASWTLFAAVPFGRSPQLAAVVSTFLALLIAILALVAGHVSTGGASLFTLLLPPAFFVFATRGLAGWENNQLTANILRPDPDREIRILPLLIVAMVNVVLFPYLAVLWEHYLYDAHEPKQRRWTLWGRKSQLNPPTSATPVDKSMAISVRNLRKAYSRNVVAVDDLSFDVPRGSLFVLLGANGSGKSTSLSVLGGLISRTSGVIWRADADGGSRGRIGIVPQSNVFNPELSCIQTVRLWSAIKTYKATRETEAELRDLLKQCDLEVKIDANASTLSGGQKRKLQLAIGLVGGSTTVLVDECTSGVDPLSRRAIWRTLNGVRGERTVIFTTHFLDEADLLGDHVAILAAPGKLLASDHPVNLKANLESAGGYTVHVSFDELQDTAARSNDLLSSLKSLCPTITVVSSPTAHIGFRLGTRESGTIGRILNFLESDGRARFHLTSYDLVGPTLEDVFLHLMALEQREKAAGLPSDEKPLTEVEGAESTAPTMSLEPAPSVQGEKAVIPLPLTVGANVPVLRQALVVVYKRYLVFRRSWLTPLLAILIGVCGCCVPLFFLENDQKQCGVREVRQERLNDTAFQSVHLWLPDSNIGYGTPLFPGMRVLVAPENVLQTLGDTFNSVSTILLADNTTFVEQINTSYKSLLLGGISFGSDTPDSPLMFSWEATAGVSSATLVNLGSNIVLNRVLQAAGATGQRFIKAEYAPFTGLGGGPLNALKWMAFFAAALSVFPPFFALYVARERRALVQAMQRSNGLTNPAALWLGHVLFDSIPGIIVATILTLVFAFAVDQFHGVGYIWLVIVLYSFTGALFAYCFVLVTSSPLAAFAACAGYQVVMFVLYLASYLLIYTYAKNSQAPHLITIIHYTIALLSPVASVLRAALVSINLFNLLCNGTGVLDGGSLGSIDKFGSPIVYLIGLGVIYFTILVVTDLQLTPTLFRRSRRPTVSSAQPSSNTQPEDVVTECQKTETEIDAPLRVLHLTKSFSRALPPQVDDLSFHCSSDSVLALLGPNGAGKSTTFNIIRGEVVQDFGEVSVSLLGVCPQFSALDTLTVREHLQVYGLLKGLPRGNILKRNVDMILESFVLSEYADRMATTLSGGNQRKLALAIALMGSPPVIIIDEYSTGIDPATKRTMWATLRRVTGGKAVVITTHSMEEAAALSTKVCIIARKMLAVGTTQSLEARFPIYDVHVGCRTSEDTQLATQIFAAIPGAKQADDVATRFEVPVGTGQDGLTLAQLFQLLSAHGGNHLEYAVERTSLETVFLKVIRANNVQEDEHLRTRHPFRWLNRRA
ncbi:P-loop containing nucleoside triphosphate hydrolase protein [Auriculariales sp. MPI-PUGE-AT-0066]|nr:P-loop containing nucleoside triphosphate hydrolase protein [Auriculariales sp. MPI-PUGE-AT-0066]